MPKTDPEELIRKTLKSGRKTASELRKLCLQEGITASKYHRHLRSLVDRGEVEHIKIDYYELAGASVDSREVLEVVENIDSAAESQDWGKCHLLFTSLHHICRNYRTGHLPKLLEALKKYVDTPELFENDDIRFELAFIMQYILRNEVDSGSLGKANQVKTVLLGPVCKIALHPNRSSRTRALFFLCETESEKSVDTIIKILARSDDKQIDQIEDTLHYALFESTLARAQGRYIREKLMEFSSSNNEPRRLRVQRLLKRPL